MKFPLLIFCILLAPCVVKGREYRPNDLAARVRESNFIALARVITVDNEFSFEPGMQQRYALVEVTRVIKGKVGKKIKFITEGFTPEFNPRCCKLGAEYLIFGTFGYPVFGEENGMDKIFMREKNTYASSADGPYGAFPISDGLVKNWNPGDSDKKLEDVVRQINTMLRSASTRRQR